MGKCFIFLCRKELRLENRRHWSKKKHSSFLSGHSVSYIFSLVTVLKII